MRTPDVPHTTVGRHCEVLVIPETMIVSDRLFDGGAQSAALGGPQTGRVFDGA